MSQADNAISPTVRRWQLTETLKQLREERGMTHDQVIAELQKTQNRWSRPKLSRIENREHHLKSYELEALLNVYHVTDQTMRDWLFELAATAHERGYWLALRKDLPEDFHSVLMVENALIWKRQFETMLVPGLLQTADFTRALINGASPGLSAEVVERRVMARMARQQVLTKPNPLRLHVILDEAILERPVGTPAVMRNQLRRLLDEAANDHVTIQILPKSTGASPALDGPFSVMTLPEPIPDFGYAEGGGRALYVEDRDAVRDYTLRFGILTEKSLSPADSVELITEAAARYA